MAGADPVEEEEAGVAAPSKGTEKDEVVVGRIEINEMAGADPVEEEEAGVAAPSKGTEKDEVVVRRIEIKVEHEVEGETVGTASVTTGPGIGPGSGSGMPDVKLELSNEVPTVEELIDQSTLPELPDAPNVEQLWDAANRPTNVAVGTKLLAEHDGQLYIAVVRSVSDLG